MKEKLRKTKLLNLLEEDDEYLDMLRWSVQRKTTNFEITKIYLIINNKQNKYTFFSYI